MAWVAALGVHSVPNPERGVFKTTDGGTTWRKVLFKSDKAGAIDLGIDPKHPDVLYAAIWEAWRKSWGMTSRAATTAASGSPPTAASTGRTSRPRWG